MTGRLPELAAVTVAVVGTALCVVPTGPDTDQPEVSVRSNADWREPYGGCDEAWRYPHTPGYRECVAHGALNPDAALAWRLLGNDGRARACRTPDAAARPWRAWLATHC